METRLVAFAAFSTGAGTVTPVRLYNCTISRNADGDYNITIGKGGVDVELMVPTVTVQGAAAAGAGTARIPNIRSVSDTVKRVQVRDDAGALALPEAVWVKLERMPPLPTP